MQSGRKADKIFRICVAVIAVLIVVYACAAAINGWTYINTLVKQGQINVKDNLFNIVTYFMQTVGMYLVYALLIFMGVKNSSQLSKMNGHIQKDSEYVNSQKLLQMSDEADVSEDMDEIIEGFQIMESPPTKYTEEKEPAAEKMELALIGIEVMEQIQSAAKQKGVSFVLDADEGFACFVQGDKPFIEQGLRLLIEIYLENCHSGNEVRMKVTDSSFQLRAVYVEFSDDVVDLLNGNLCSNREKVLQVQSFNNYIVQLNGNVKTHSDENGCYTEIMLQTQ